MQPGNYRIVIEEEQKDDTATPMWRIVALLLLAVPVAIVAAMLLVAWSEVIK